MCKGWRVFFSPIKEKPKILFIGINPGAGQPGVVDLECEGIDKEKLEYIEYWDDNTNTFIESKYTLALETKKVFELAEMTELLNDAVKINYFFLSTASEKELYKITDVLGRGGINQRLLGDRFFDYSFEWTKKLISQIKPYVIVCEGKQAYTNVMEALYPDIKPMWNNDCSVTITPSHKVIGYKRNHSKIKNKDELAIQLRNAFKS